MPEKVIAECWTGTVSTMSRPSTPLSALLAATPDAGTRVATGDPGGDPIITDICFDSRRVTPGSLFDAVYEQTCLCALHPDRWVPYARRLHAWLRSGGRLFALFAQVARPGAAIGSIAGPPYHCDINAMRTLFDGTRWHWPEPPYERVPHPAGFAELAVVLVRT